jgi:hypothetical protein
MFPVQLEESQNASVYLEEFEGMSSPIGRWLEKILSPIDKIRGNSAWGTESWANVLPLKRYLIPNSISPLSGSNYVLQRALLLNCCPTSLCSTFFCIWSKVHLQYNTSGKIDGVRFRKAPRRKVRDTKVKGPETKLKIPLQL